MKWRPRVAPYPLWRYELPLRLYPAPHARRLRDGESVVERRGDHCVIHEGVRGTRDKGEGLGARLIRPLSNAHTNMTLRWPVA